MYDVVIITDARFVDKEPTNEWMTNVYKEDQLVADALEKLGYKTKKVAWSDANFDWNSTTYGLFRSTWDYAERFQEFADWLIDVSLKTRLINSYDIISWNLDKHYLNDLKKNDVNIVETHFIEHGDSRSLHQIHSELGWDQTVLKPAISASAKNTFKLDNQNLSTHEDRFKEIIGSEAMMLQPFQHSVIERGEVSLMVMGGAFTHAVLKMAKPGDFRVQDDFGGTVQDYQPTKGEIALATNAINACIEVPTYARVDIINDNNGNPAVAEVELVEPELWFRNSPEAADALAKAIASQF